MQINRPKIVFFNVAKDWKISPRIPIESAEQVRTLLVELSKGAPGIVNFESAAKNLLQVGIGGKFACAQFTTNDDESRYLCAKPQIIQVMEDVEFLCGGTPTPIAPEYCLLFEEAVKIAEFFFHTGNRDPSVEWVDFQ